MESMPPGLDIDAKIWRTLLEIEQRAPSWVIPNKAFEHRYGRLPDEIEIRAWSIPRASGLFLYSLVRILRPTRILEVGTSFAYSTLWLSAAAPRGTKVHTIELLPEKLEIAREHLESAGVSNVKLHAREALEVTAEWKKSLDFTFFDADPENYITYFNSLAPHFTSNALLVMDNALNHANETNPFIEFMIQQKKWRSWIHPLDHGFLIAVRNGDA